MAYRLPVDEQRLAEYRQHAGRLARTIGIPMEDAWATIWPSSVITKSSDPEFILQCSNDEPDVLYTPVRLPWAKARAFNGFRFQMVGRIATKPTMRHWIVDTDDVGPLIIEIWALRIPVSIRVMVSMQHDPVSNTQKRLVETDDPGDTWEDDWTRTKLAMRALHVDFKAPGPKPGTGAIFKTPKEFHDALRKDVLPQNTLATATPSSIAFWLGDICTSTLFKLMKKWGPKTLEELKAGKF